MEWIIQEYWPIAIGVVLVVYFGRALERIEDMCADMRADIDTIINTLQAEQDALDREPPPYAPDNRLDDLSTLQSVRRNSSGI